MLNKEPSDIATIADVLIFFVCHFSMPLSENLNQIAILQIGDSNYDDLFPWFHTFHCHITLVGLTQRHSSQMCGPFAVYFAGDEDAIAPRCGRVSDNSC